VRWAAFGYYVRFFRLHSPRVVVRTALDLARRKIEKRGQRLADLRESTFAGEAPGEPLLRYTQVLPFSAGAPDYYTLIEACEHYLAHRFDLLGSGWTEVRHGRRCAGLEGYRYDAGPSVRADSQGQWLEGRVNAANLEECARIWRLVDAAYTPIDWQLDFKSGFRWREDTWYRDIRYGDQLGADVKVPRELARMQHLAQLARAYAAARAGHSGFAAPERYATEFRNQVLDFIATNPPRFGANWECTMDVAIRSANWLLAYDLLRAAGARFDAEFERVFSRSALEHGRHIVGNLEWHAALHANHYLANIAGLLFVAAYLPRTEETDRWLGFAVQELVAEVEHQFLPDGGNFEASTCYHQLSAEMVLYATALVLGLPAEKRAALERYVHRPWKVQPRLRPAPLALYGGQDSARTPFAPWYAERLRRMGEFTTHITKPNGRIPQIGDNDSGRFFKLVAPSHVRSVIEAKTLYANLADYDEQLPAGRYLDERRLDFRHLAAAIGALFGDAEEGVDATLAASLAKSVRLGSRGQRAHGAENFAVGDATRWEDLHRRLENDASITKRSFEISLSGREVPVDLRRYAYPDFGLYLLRSGQNYVAVRCGRVDVAKTNAAHAHNDQLAIEVNVDGQDVIADPGSYLYTPLPDRRNAFRSVQAHGAPSVGWREPSSLGIGLFKLEDRARARCLYFGECGFAGVHWGYGAPVYRIVEISAEAAKVTDYASVGQVSISSQPGDLQRGIRPYSPGYGVLLTPRRGRASGNGCGRLNNDNPSPRVAGKG
jgi:hypothetical protein